MASIYSQFFLSFLVIAGLAIGGPAQAASFDCLATQRKVEQLICKNPGLNKQDLDLNGSYDQLRSATDDRVALAADQRMWVNSVRDRCRTVACLREAYGKRIVYLQALAETATEARAKAPTCGVKRPESAPYTCLGSHKEDENERFTCAVNADHSIFLTVADHCSDGKPNSVNVYFYQNRQSAPTSLGRLDRANMASWKDLDRNGFAELDVMDACARLCPEALYHYDPKSKALYHYFSGSYDELFYLPGYLIEQTAQNGINEYDVHKLHRVGLRDWVGGKFIIISSTIRNRQEESDPISCSFSQVLDEKTGERRSIKPPGREWLRFCRYYGKHYRIN